MNSKYLVSIVIPVYKVEKYLRLCVESVINQTYKNIEIILVDDGSPDTCPIICDELASLYKNIIVIHKENGGLSEARNYGIEKSRGSYILFLDSDDTLVNNAVEELISIVIEDYADIVIPDRYIQIEEGTDKKEIKLHFKERDYETNAIKFALNTIIAKGRAWRASGVLYSGSLIKSNKIKFPVGYVAEDIVFNLKIMAKANKLIIHNKSTLQCLRRAGSITTSFQEDFDKVFLFIDDKVEEFLLEINESSNYSQIKRKELLCRNSIVYITSIFSDKCPYDSERKKKSVKNYLQNERVDSAFRIKKINPFFNSIIAAAYFNMMFILIKYKLKSIYFILAKLQGNINKR